MRIRTLVQSLFAGVGFAIVATAADADIITIEPDNYVGLMGDVAPGAALSTFRSNGVGSIMTDVHSVVGGSWAPTGNRVFGHQAKAPGETAHHWDHLTEASECSFMPGSCDEPFYVFRVDFDAPTREVSILTTLRGEQAPDGMELQAFDEVGDRILHCHVFGVSNTVLETGVLPAPRYVVHGSPSGSICGKVVAKKNCTGHRGHCDYVVRAILRTEQNEIHTALAGGLLLQNSWANVDKLQYVLD
jgi:hypothetical protein